MDEPPVKLEIRTGGMQRSPFRFEDDWPIPRTKWTKMYLRIDRDPVENAKAVEGEMVNAPLAKESKVSYGAAAPTRPGKIPRGVSFETAPMAQDTEVTGHIVLNVWVSSNKEDMDIFATIRNIDPSGNDVMETGQMGEPLQCVTKGWLRASHRKLDAKLSTASRPYHTHDEKQPLKPGEIVPLDIELWPTSIVIPPEHRIALTVRGRDYEFAKSTGARLSNFKNELLGCGPFLHDDPRDRPAAVFGGMTTLHFGAGQEGFVLLPVIPKCGGTGLPTLSAQAMHRATTDK